MPDYEYGNARLHVMKSRLLSSRELETLADSGSLQGLIAALTKTVYQKAVETALTRATGLSCLNEALHNDLISTVGKIRGFYQESAGKLVAVLFRTYDLHNLKALLRGLARHIPANEILSVFLPVGELHLQTLQELARLNSPREAIDHLASMGFPCASPLLNLRVETSAAEPLEMELALDRWYYQEARQTLRSENSSGGALADALALEADLANLLTALRFAQSPHERSLLRDQLGTDEITHLFIGPGRLPFAQLANAARQETVTSAIETTLSGTAFEPALRAGLEVYARSSRLSDIEKQLRRYRLRWMAGQISTDPLGIGVVLGYLALKINEIGNLRWIAQGINLGINLEAIRAELELVP